MLSVKLRCIAQKRLLAHRRYLTTLGIRCEDPGRIWERRAPLTPRAVQELINDRAAYAGGDELAVEVESCGRRCFTDAEYEQAGAKIVPELSGRVDVVLGIKEPPVKSVHALLNGQGGDRPRQWAVFSHTHKGQKYNTALLSSYLGDKQQSLLDWELLTGPSRGASNKGKLERVAAFGWYAGAVGAGEALTLMGLARLKRGLASPLLHLPRPYTFSSLEEYEAGLRTTGEAMRARHIPGKPHTAQIIGLTGSGKVSTGAEHILQTIGAKRLDASELQGVFNSSPEHPLYYCMVPPSAYFKRDDGAAWDRSDYYTNPTRWTSHFDELVAPYLFALINGAGWSPGFPRIMSSAGLANLANRAGSTEEANLAVVQDITCDISGNLEFVDRHTTIDEPCYVGQRGILISSVDILPTELPKDASSHFSNCIMPYVKRLTSSTEAKGEESEHQESLARATIVRAGRLTKEHEWLQANVDEYKAGGSDIPRPLPSSSTKHGTRVLLLGSGMVAGPAVEVFAARPDVQLSVASNNLKETQALLAQYPAATAMSLDVSNRSAVAEAVDKHDVVVSLLPAPMHVQIAEHCIALGKHLVTASYVSPEMKALHQKAQDAGIVILGECGLDPGIDSMAAMRIMDRVEHEGKRVTSFKSWCGGLPELSAADNLLKYKFSWSPKAVMTASLNPAHFKLDGQVRKIDGDRLLDDHFTDVELFEGLPLEGLANRDSMPYAEKYRLPPAEQLTSLFRGTLRYKGFSKIMSAFKRLGLLSKEPLPKPVENWVDFLPAVMEANNRSADNKIVPDGKHQDLQKALSWLSRMGGVTKTIPPPSSHLRAPIDLFAELLSHLCVYEAGERDVTLLHHEFGLSSDTGKAETVTASLICYGDDKSSAMAKTVGMTLAFAALRVLDGHVARSGVIGPYGKEVWEGVLNSLAQAGISVEEQWSEAP